MTTTTTTTRNNKDALLAQGALVAIGIALGSVITTLVFWRPRHELLLFLMDAVGLHSRHALNSQARAMDTHLRATQTPAKALGIRVHAFDEAETTYLELQAPLRLNTNVHDTAFAGSLFSLGVLTSFYLTRQWMMIKGMLDDNKYTLVARSATIRYRKPVTSAKIIAHSVLPAVRLLTAFCQHLERTGKATLNVKGTIVQTDKGVDVVACDYSVECCAYVPKDK